MKKDINELLRFERRILHYESNKIPLTPYELEIIYFEEDIL